MVSYSFEETTSTTSNESESPENSSDGSLLDAHIGDIIDVGDNGTIPQTRERPEDSAPSMLSSRSSANNDDSQEAASYDENSAASSHDGSQITYDSFMDEIRKEVWEQVRRKKTKRSKKGTNKNERDETPDQQTPPETSPRGNGAFNKTQQPAAPEEQAHEAVPRVSGALHQTQQPTAQEEHASYDSSNSASTPHSKLHWYYEPLQLEEPHQNSPVSTSQASTHVTNEREMISDGSQDDIGSLIDEALVLDEPSTYDPFEDDPYKNTVHPPHENPRMPPALSSKIAVRVLEEAEINSAFESILSIDLESKSQEKPSSLRDISASTERSEFPQVSFAPSEPFITAKINGLREDTILYVPFFLIEKRENEMFKVAFNQGIRTDQWNGSLLCNKFKSLYDPHDPSDVCVMVELHPESECAAEHYSQGFQWQSWISECIESFYKTGSMRVPDFCVGSDLLVALQYFGILYTPDQLLFDSFSTYLRVKLWSEYFTHRHTMANWLFKKLSHAEANGTKIFVTCPSPPQEGLDIQIATNEAEVFDGGIFSSPKRYEKIRSSEVVYGFFNENDDEDNEPMNIDVLMREDFCHYFRKFVPDIKASFTKKLAIISHPDGTREQLELATLYIRQKTSEPAVTPEEESQTKSESDSSETTASSNNVTWSPASLLTGCQALHAPKFPQCDAQDKLMTIEPRPSHDNDQWIPVGNPECVSKSSYLEYKESMNKIPALWMSRTEPADIQYIKPLSSSQEPISKAGICSMGVQHVKPLSSSEEALSIARSGSSGMVVQHIKPLPSSEEPLSMVRSGSSGMAVHHMKPSPSREEKLSIVRSDSSSMEVQHTKLVPLSDKQLSTLKSDSSSMEVQDTKPLPLSDEQISMVRRSDSNSMAVHHQKSLKSSEDSTSIMGSDSSSMAVQHPKRLPLNEELFSMVRSGSSSMTSEDSNSIMRSQSSSMAVQHTKPLGLNEEPISMLSSGSGSMVVMADTSIGEGSIAFSKLNVDHIYEDLWLQDTAFEEGWEREIEKNIETRTEPVTQIDNLELLQEARPQVPKSTLPKDRSLLDQEPALASREDTERPSFKYYPNEFVRDVVELFAPSPKEKQSCSEEMMCVMEEDRPNRNTHRRPRRSKPHDVAHLKQNMLPRPPRPLAVAPMPAIARQFLYKQNMANVLDDCTDTSTTGSTSLFAGLEPDFPMLIPGVDYPEDEKSSFLSGL